VEHDHGWKEKPVCIYRSQHEGTKANEGITRCETKRAKGKNIVRSKLKETHGINGIA